MSPTDPTLTCKCGMYSLARGCVEVLVNETIQVHHRADICATFGEVCSKLIAFQADHEIAFNAGACLGAAWMYGKMGGTEADGAANIGGFMWPESLGARHYTMWQEHRALAALAGTPKEEGNG